MKTAEDAEDAEGLECFCRYESRRLSRKSYRSIRLGSKEMTSSAFSGALCGFHFCRPAFAVSCRR